MEIVIMYIGSKYNLMYNALKMEDKNKQGPTAQDTIFNIP